jgi:hypothetical protein
MTKKLYQLMGFLKTPPSVYNVLIKSAKNFITDFL